MVYGVDRQTIMDLITACGWNPDNPDMDFMDRHDLEDVDVFASVSNFQTFMDELESIGVIRPDCVDFYQITNNKGVIAMLEDFMVW